MMLIVKTSIETESALQSSIYEMSAELWNYLELRKWGRENHPVLQTEMADIIRKHLQLVDSK